MILSIRQANELDLRSSYFERAIKFFGHDAGTMLACAVVMGGAYTKTDLSPCTINTEACTEGCKVRDTEQTDYRVQNSS